VWDIPHVEGLSVSKGGGGPTKENGPVRAATALRKGVLGPSVEIPYKANLPELKGSCGYGKQRVKGYLVDLGQYFEWLGRRDPLGVTAQDVRRYAHTMQAARLAPRTRARRTTALRACYEGCP